MIDQLRRKLDQADTWLKYRQELKEFRELYGPVFEHVPRVARERLGVKNAPGKTSFVNLTRPFDAPPEWPYVALLIRVCVRHAQDDKEGMEDLGAHLKEILALWREAFVRLGGKLPEPPPARNTMPVPSVGEPAPSGGEPPVVALAGTPDRRRPSRWRAAHDWVRRWPKKLTIPVGLLVVAALGLGGYALTDVDWDKDRTVEAAGTTPSSAPPASTTTPSSPATASASGTSSASPTGSASTAGTASGATTGDTGTGTHVGEAGTASGGTGSGDASRGTGSSGDSSSTVSGGVSGTGGTSSSGGGTTTETQPYISSEIAWSNDVDGNPDPKDPQAIVQVYDTYKKGVTATSVHGYYRTNSIRVKCQVTGGRVIDLGDYYSGPTPHRDGIWYLMDTGEWVPAVYVNTHQSSLPACSAADSDAAS